MNVRRAVGRVFSGLTPRAFREAVDAHIGPAVEEWATRMGYTHTALAAELDVARQTLDQYLRGPAAPKGVRMTVGMLYAMPLPVRVLAAEDLVGEDYAVVAIPKASVRGGCDRRFLSRAMRGGVDALATAVEHGEDGHITRAEAAVLLPMAEKHLRDVLAIIELAREAERTGIATLATGRELDA